MMQAMLDESRIRAERIRDEATRAEALKVLSATYQDEKRWIADPARQFPPGDLGRADIAWFIVRHDGCPAGVMRTLYDPPLAQYAKYDLKPIEMTARIDVAAFLRQNRIAEVGRFAVLAKHRGNVLLAAALMRAATEEMVARGYTHVITDVFEDDPHSPLGFHTRVMGFLPVATHDHGELNCKSRRITLVLDLKSSYRRLKARGNWVYRYLTAHWPEAFHRRLAA
jgi:hypothetical protein